MTEDDDRGTEIAFAFLSDLCGECLFIIDKEGRHSEQHRAACLMVRTGNIYRNFNFLFCSFQQDLCAVIFDGPVKSRETSSFVIPAKAGTQLCQIVPDCLDFPINRKVTTFYETVKFEQPYKIKKAGPLEDPAFFLEKSDGFN